MSDTLEPARGSIRGFVDRDHVRCVCGHVDEITDHGDYKVVPTGRYRWRTDPATSEVWQQVEYEYMCAPCWSALPDA